jgi:hypothetical protein
MGDTCVQVTTQPSSDSSEHLLRLFDEARAPGT